MSTIPAHLRSERATVVEPGRAAVASALALDSTVSLPASPALNPTGDTVKARRSTPDWGAALGLGAFDQQDLFQRAMARVFSDDPEASAAPRIGRFTILRRLGGRDAKPSHRRHDAGGRVGSADRHLYR